MKQKSTLKMVVVVSIATVMIGAISASSILLPSNKLEAAGTGVTTNKTTASTNTTKDKPVTGYDSPQGYFTAIKHVYNDPNLRVSAFCKPGVKIVATCQIYDSSSPNTGRLIGLEYIITAKDYNSLPANEKLNWYIINKALATTVQGQFPELNPQQINMVLQHLLGNYGKLVLTWNPLDNLPTATPRIENLQNLFVLNQTSRSTSK